MLAGQKIEAIRVRPDAGGPLETFPVLPQWLLAAPDAVSNQAERRIFYRGEALLYGISFAPHQVEAVTSRGQVIPLGFSTRGWAGLGLPFWMPILAGLLSISLGTAVFVHTKRDIGTILFFCGTLAYLVAMCGRAWIADRPWGQDPQVWGFLLPLTHSAAALFLLCEVGSLMRAPTRLVSLKWFFVLVAVESLVLLTDIMRWADSTRVTHFVPLVSLGLAALVLIAFQAQAIKKTPQARLFMKWVLLGVAISTSMGVLVTVVNLWLNASTQAVAVLNLIPVVTVFTHAALLVRTHLYRLETWWWRTWLWLVAGLTVIAIEGFVLAFTSISGQFSLTIALAVSGWLYFPLRQWMMLRFAPISTQTIDAFVPALMELSTIHVQQGDIQAHWRRIVERAFEPQSVATIDAGRGPGDGGAGLDVHSAILPVIEEGGEHLRVPGLTRQTLVLTGANRGQRAFTHSDLQLAASLLEIARQGLRAQTLYSRGANEERRRIAADLHDDIGGKLLHLANRPGEDGRYARNTLEDLRTITRGLSAETRPLTDLLADLKYQLAERADRQGLQLEWIDQTQALHQHDIGSRQGTLLTSICSELLRNAMQHGRAQSISYRLAACAERMSLTVISHGTSTDPATWTAGLGTASIRRRIHDLGGVCEWSGLTVDSGLPGSAGIAFTAHWPVPAWLQSEPGRVARPAVQP